MEQIRHARKHPQRLDQIETQIENDSRELARSLAGLRTKLTPDWTFSDVLDRVTRSAGSVGKTIGGVIRANPVATGLAGAGLVWLMFRPRQPVPVTPPLAGTKVEAMARWADDGGPVHPAAEDDDDDDDDWMKDADRLRDRASVLLAQLDRAVRDQLAPAADLASSRTEVLTALTRDVRRSMERGLGSLTQSARDAALATREAAYVARLSAGRAGKQAVTNQPLVAGAVLAAAGAALAAALPRTAAENAIAGKAKDRLAAEADRLLRSEAQRVADAVRDLADTVAQDLKGLYTHLDRAAQGLVNPLSRAAQDHPDRHRQ